MKASLACLILLSAVIPVSAVEYEVDGQIEQILYNRDGSVGALEKSQFTVFVKDCAWLIQTTDLDKAGKPVAMRETACTNGAEVYEVSGPINGGNTSAGHRPSSWNVATIVSNNVPVGQTAGYFVCHLWLMFASGCYFENSATNRLTPVYDSNASASVNPHLTRRAEWELVNGPGSLPLSVVYFVEFSHITNATYVTTGVTNVDKLKIPRGFVFEYRINGVHYFAPGPIPPGGTLPAYHILRRAVATVTAVRPYCSRSDLSPIATGKTMVIDERSTNYLTHPNNLPTYIVKTGAQWLPLAKAQQSYVSRRIPPKPPSRGIVAIMLLLPTAALLLFLWLNRKRG
jgi:hypothetical protein